MLDLAESELMKIDIESTSPPKSHLFSVLSNLFVALDVLSVSLSGDESTQFSHVSRAELKSAGCSDDIVSAFISLKDTTLTGVVPSQPGRIEHYEPWHLWSAYKHRGIGDVALLRDKDNNSLQLRLGEVVTPREEIEKYVRAARALVAMTK